MVSALFYRIESKGQKLNKSHNVFNEELRILSEELNVHSVLNAFSQIVEHINKSKLYSSGHCVIVAETNKNIAVTVFYNSKESHDFTWARKKSAKNRYQVVTMVSASSINELKAAYPSFFFGGKAFLNNFVDSLSNGMPFQAVQVSESCCFLLLDRQVSVYTNVYVSYTSL